MTLFTNILLKDQDQFISIWMTVHLTLLKYQFERHLGCKFNTKQGLWENELFKSKLVHLFHLYSDASKIYFEKYLFKTLISYYDVKVTLNVRKHRKLGW